MDSSAWSLYVATCGNHGCDEANKDQSASCLRFFCMTTLWEEADVSDHGRL